MTDVNQLVRDAILVADYLKTRYVSKKHGGYNIYEDDKIRISIDTYYPNLTVSVRFGDEFKPVLTSSGQTVYSHHPGAWEAYVTSLAIKATEVKNRRAAELKAKRETERAAKFAPIDDTHIFAEAAK